MVRRQKDKSNYSFEDLDRDMAARQNAAHIQNECTYLYEIRLTER